MAHHRDMIATVYKTTGIRLVEYQLDPVDLRNPGQWALWHQLMHSQLDNVLGTTQFGGFDIEQLDFNNPEAAQGWAWQHATMHYHEAAASNTW